MIKFFQQNSSSIWNRVIKGAGAQGFGQAVLIFIRFVEVPLLLYFWGTQLYGEWLMLAAIPTYLEISDGGFTTAATREMSIRSAAGDKEGAISIFQSIWGLLSIITAIIISISTLLLFIFDLPINKWLGFQEISSDMVHLVLSILILYILVGFQAGLLNGSYWCTGNYPLGMSLTSFMKLIEFVLFAISIALGGGPFAAALAILIGRIIGTIILRYGLLKTTPWLQYGLKNGSWKEVSGLTIPAFASLAFPLGNAFNIQGIRLVIGIVLGPTSLAIFTPIRTLSRLGMQPRAIVDRLVQPEMSMAYGDNNDDLVRRLFTRSCQISFWLALITIFILVITGNLILSMWTINEVSMDWALYILLLLSVLVNSIWFIALMVMYATNRHERIAVQFLIVYGIFALLLSYWGAFSLGLWGVGVAILLSEIIMGIFVVPKALTLTAEQWQNWLLNLLKPPWFLVGKIKTSFHRGET